MIELGKGKRMQVKEGKTEGKTWDEVQAVGKKDAIRMKLNHTRLNFVNNSVKNKQDKKNVSTDINSSSLLLVFD